MLAVGRRAAGEPLVVEEFRTNRYDDATELLRASLMALGEDGQFGDTFSRHTTTPMLLDRPVVFDVSAIDTAEIKLFDPDGGRSLTYAETNGAGSGAGSKAASAAPSA